MAKNDNLTDFLRGIADKLRSLMGTSAAINPQDFEDKIQSVYDKGFSEGGPTGITAAASDVLAGKVYGSGGSAKATGTMPDQSTSIYNITTDTTNQSKGAFWLRPENDLWIVPGKGYWGAWDWNVSRLTITAANLRSAIGLTAAKLMKGNTVLGISGTGVPVACAYGTLYTNLGTGENVLYPLSGTAKGGLSFASNGIRLIAGTYVGLVACDRNNLNIASVRKNGAELPLQNIGNIRVRFVNQFTANAGDILTIYMGGLPNYSCDMGFVFVRIA